MAEKAEMYKKLFKEADANGDGFLTVQELKTILQKGGSKLSDKEVADTFLFFDGPKGDKRVTLQEFTTGLDNILEFMNQLEEMFNELDKSKDGFLDKNELKGLLAETGKKYTDAEVNEILQEADTNKDNKINFKEFVGACARI